MKPSIQMPRRPAEKGAPAPAAPSAAETPTSGPETSSAEQNPDFGRSAAAEASYGATAAAGDEAQSFLVQMASGIARALLGGIKETFRLTEQEFRQVVEDIAGE